MIIFLPIIDDMASQSLVQIILEVLKDPRVIVTAIICFVAMDLSCYIVRYRKKPKARKRKPVAPQVSTQNAEPDADDSANSQDSDSED